MTAVARVLLGALLAGFASDVAAHEVRPGYLQIEPGAEANGYALLWKVPARGDRRLAIDVALPDDCRDAEPLRARFAEGAYVERRTIACEEPLLGRPIAIDGLAATKTDVIVRLERADGTVQSARLTPEQPSFVVTSSAGLAEVARTYLGLGFEHILLGADHLLFVLGLLFLVRSWRRLVATVTAFTVAHSFTLAAATLGWVRVPSAPVEAVIALSIVFVADEIVRARRTGIDLAARAPWIVAFVFGLLHGFGFAGALAEVGIPEHAIPAALLFFNVGVELGQLAFVAAMAVAFGAVSALRRRQDHGSSLWNVADVVRVPVAYAIGGVAAFWLIERFVGFWA